MEFLYILCLYAYSRVMLKVAILKLRLAGWWHGLPSLKGYSDHQIAEGLRRLKHRSPFKEYDEQ